MKIAILGMGKIGSGVYELLANHAEIEVKRTLDLRVWMDNMTTDINDIVSDTEISAVVETMGGVEPARTYALKCLEAGKHYITANKHLVSECMHELNSAARKSGAAFLFSAACGGGIPYLRSLAEQRKCDEILSVGGILNGTTNYMLDRIETDNMDYASALSEAQALGYAEADPTSDVDGLDAQRKLVLAVAVGFSRQVNPSLIPTRGIRGITPQDIAYYKKNNLSPRLIAEASLTECGVNASVCVHLFPSNAPEAAIKKNVNYAFYKGEKSGSFSFSGQGAGKYPTAANVIGDLTRILSGEKNMLLASLSSLDKIDSSEHIYYVRVPETDLNDIGYLFSSSETENGFVLGVTRPVDDAELFEIMKNTGESFFARMD